MSQILKILDLIFGKPRDNADPDPVGVPYDDNEQMIPMGPYDTLNSKIISTGDWRHDQYGGMRVGPCGEDGAEPTHTIANVQLGRADIERLALVSTYEPHWFMLSPSVYGGTNKDGKEIFKPGHICWPFKNGHINDMVLNADCEMLFPGDDAKCDTFKRAIASLTGQFLEKSGPEFLKERVNGTWCGIDFGVGLAIVSGIGIGLTYLGRFVWKIIQDRNDKDGGGPGGAAPGGGAGDQVPAVAEAPSGAAQFSLDPEIVREMEYRVTESRRIHAIDTYEPNNVTSWKISLAPAIVVSAYFAAGLAVDAGLAALARMAFASEAVGAIAGGVGMVEINIAWRL